MIQNVEIARLVVPSNMSPVTIAIVEAIKTGTPEQTLTFDDLSKSIVNYAPAGKTLENGLAHNLYSAIRYCERVHHVVWRKQCGETAIKCLTNAEKMEESESRAARSRRNSTRAIRVLGTVDTSDMSDGQRTEYNTQCAVHGTLAMFASGRSIKAMAARKVTKALDMTELLEAMK